MSMIDLPTNLKLLCGYEPSVTKACRRLGINRSQFYRYLQGKTYPSLRNLRRICDHFGVEEDEILQDQETFRRIVALRKPHGRQLDPLGEYVLKLHEINPRSSRDLRPYLGYYYSHFRPSEFPGKTIRSLVRFFEHDGFVYNKTIENYSKLRRRKRNILKYSGIVLHSGDKIFVFERETSTGKMMWQTILHPAESDQFNVLVGLTLGVTSGTTRDISCYRAVWEYLGQEVPLRETLLECGIFDSDSPAIPLDIRERIVNDIRPDEGAFVYRP